MNIKLYTTDKVKFDKYGYGLKAITMDYSYGENFLVYKFVNTANKTYEISIPTVNEVVIRNKSILKTAIELMNIFTDNTSTILGCLPDELVTNNESVFAKFDDNKEYNRILTSKVSNHLNNLANKTAHTN